MSIFDTLSIALKNLWRRKLRAFLTVLGMVIGVAAIVVMVSLGIGINQYFVEMYQQGGDLTNITVNQYRMQTDSSGGMMVSYGDDIILDNKAVDALRKIDGVEAVMPMLQTYGLIKSGQYISNISIMGVDLAVAEQFGYEVAEGSLPGPHSGSTYEMVFNSWVLKGFYNPRNGKQAIDKDGNSRITLDSRFQLTFDWANFYDSGSMDWGEEQQTRGKIYKMRPTGVFPEDNYSIWYCIMDVNAVKKLAKENKEQMNLNTDRYSQIMVKCKDMDQVLDIQQKIIDMGYGAESQQQWLEQATESMSSLQLLLGAIGGVALLVAAIGIMNTMMMSIYERTKEIGIIKVLGCRMGNIAGQFLSEAAYIGLFGGALGLGLSYGLSAVLNKFVFSADTYGIGSMMRSVIPLYLALGAVAFSIGVALISGMYPALRAMRLSALTAIRNE